MNLFSKHEINFFKNIGITSIGILFSGASSMFCTFFIARKLGAANFGYYSTALGMAQLFTLPMMLGVNTAMTHYMPSTKRHKTIASTGTALLMSISLPVFFLLYMLHGEISNYFKVPETITVAAIFLAITLVARYGGDAVLRGLMLFRFSALNEFISATTVVVIICALLISKNTNPIGYVLATGIGAISYFILASIRNRKLFSYSYISRSETRELSHYGFLALIASIAQMLLTQTDKIILNYEHGPTITGTYSVYLSSSFIVTALAFTVTNYVLLPTFSEIRSIRSIIKKINSYIVSGFISVFLFSAVVSFLYLKLLGKSYELNIFWVLLSSAYAAVYFIANVFIVIGFSRGKNEMIQVARYLVYCALVFIFSAITLGSRYGISGMLSSLLVVYSLAAVIFYLRLWRYNN